MTPPWKTHLDTLQIKDLNELFRTSKPVIGMRPWSWRATVRC